MRRFLFTKQNIGFKIYKASNWLMWPIVVSYSQAPHMQMSLRNSVLKYKILFYPHVIMIFPLIG